MKTHNSTQPGLRRQPWFWPARTGIRGIVAAAVLLGGVRLALPTSAVLADNPPQFIQPTNFPLGDGSVHWLSGGNPVPSPTPQPLCVHPPTHPCPRPSPGMTVLDDEGQPAVRLDQGEKVTVTVADFPAGSVSVSFGGQLLGTVTDGVPVQYYLPYSVAGGQYVTFTAHQGDRSATDTVWFDYAPQ